VNEGDLVFPDAMQKIICEKYGVPVLPPEKIVAIAVQTLGQAPIYGSRVELPEGEMSAGSFTAASIQQRLIFTSRFAFII
jgi:hypothetical protein